MTINPNLLVSAAMLQDYLVDKDTGKPLANGLVTLYKDEARSFYKNWYYQTGVPGAYTYIPLDNPMHLSSVGTIQDPNGNDVIPFYYPFEEDDENVPEAYYITVYSVDENGDQAVLQFTRENFPFQPTGVSPTSQIPTLDNIIVNNVFWRNVGSLDAMNVLDSVIAPSQHNGFTNGDIRFIKNIAGANDDLIFSPMTENLDNDITPELYLNMQCTSVQAGETVKCIQYPVSLHIKTLANVNATLVIQAQNVSGNPNNYLDLYVYQYLGTGALTQPVPILIQRITLNNSFQKFVIPFTFPDNAGLTLGEGTDDALFIRVQYPLSATFNINHTKTSIYLSETVPDNDFITYAEIDRVIDSARTADVKTSYNFTSPTYPTPGGWIFMNDGTIGSTSSGGTVRSNNDTFPLYSIIWNSILIDFCPLILAGVEVSKGASAYADFTANKQIFIPKALGRVLSGADPTGVNFAKTFVRSGNTLIINNSSGFYTGTPFTVTNTGGALPNPLTAFTTYYMVVVDGVTVEVASTLLNAEAGVIIPLTTAGSGLNVLTATLPAHSLGQYVGEDQHALIINEIPAHTHPGSTVPTNVAAGGAPLSVVGSGNAPANSVGVNIAAQGGGGVHNTLQPTTYTNYIMKL